MIDILNRSDKIAVGLSPAFIAIVGFCFSMVIGVLWEFFEFAMDVILKTDMQKDTVIASISSVFLNPNGANIPIKLKTQSLAINGNQWNIGGYIDIGLFDTMKDLLMNFIGAAVFSYVGYLYIVDRGKLARNLIPTIRNKSSDSSLVNSAASDNADDQEIDPSGEKPKKKPADQTPGAE